MRKFLTALFFSAGAAVASASETSMNFDSENVRPFLEQLRAIEPNLVKPDVVASIERALSDMNVGETRSFVLSIAGDLRLEIYLDDIDAPDLYFFGSDPVIENIDGALVDFADAMGL